MVYFVGHFMEIPFTAPRPVCLGDRFVDFSYHNPQQSTLASTDLPMHRGRGKLACVGGGGGSFEPFSWGPPSWAPVMEPCKWS